MSKAKTPAAMQNIAAGGFALAPSEPALMCLCTTQALETCASNPPGAGLVDCPGLMKRSH